MKTTSKFVFVYLLVSVSFLWAQDPVTPLDGASNVLQTTATITWTDFDEGGFGDGPYDVEFSDASDFSNILASASGTAATSLNLPALNFNDTYYWRVRDTDTDGSGADGTWQKQPAGYYSFTTVTQLTAGANSSPADVVTGQSLTPTLQWSAATGGIAPYTYIVKIYNDAGLTNQVYSASAGASLNLAVPAATLDNNDTYFWKVDITDNSTQSASTAATRFTTLLDVPVPAAPAMSSVATSETPNFTWTIADSYSNVEFHLLLNTSSGVAYPADDNNDVTGALTMQPASALASGTKYFWKIYAETVSGDNTGENTISASEFEFYTPVVPEEPVNGLTGITVEPTFVWQDASFETEYELKISTEGSDQTAFDNNVILTETGIAANSTSISFDETHTSGVFPLDNDETYYWQIIGKDGVIEVPSPIWHFSTIPEVTVDLNFPANGDNIHTTNTQFGWSINQALGSLQFEIQVKESNTMPDADDWTNSEFSATTTDTWQAFNLLLNKKYYWRVNVLNADDEIVYRQTAVWFSTIGGAQVPTPSWPVGGETMYTTSPYLYWYLETQTTDLDYDLRYREQGGGWVEELDIDALFFNLTNLDEGTTYEWEVRSVYMRGTADEDVSGWSATESFVTYSTTTVSQPYLSYPIDDAIVYSSSPYLYWYLEEIATGVDYTVYYRQGTSGAFIAAAPTTQNLSYQLTNLTAGATYQWYVEATDGNTTLTSATESFSVTGGSANSYAVVNWPTGNPIPTVYTNAPTLSWYVEGGTLGLTKYTVKWKADSPPANWATYNTLTADVNDVNQTTYELSNLDYGTTYYWAVAAYDDSYSAWAEGEFTVVGGASGVPILSNPDNGMTVYAADVTLSWYVNGSTLGIDEYEIMYSRSDVWAASVTTTTTSATQSVTIEDLIPGATYYWKVNSKYTNGGESGYSAPFSFYINTGANGPVQPIVGGPNNVMISQGNPFMTWALPMSPTQGTTYELELATDENMSSAQVFSNISTTGYIVSNLSSSQTYYWRVRSKTGSDYSYYSGSGKFQTNQALGTEDESSLIPDKFTVEQNYPNPFNPSTTIKFSVPEVSDVRISIYDMLGREVNVLIDQELQAGSYDVVWNGTDRSGSKVATGAYIYKIKAGSNVAVKKMILMK